MSKALVILSGGQDSTTCAAIACQQFDQVCAITFNYGQRHSIEIESAKDVGFRLGIKQHEFIDIPHILIGSSPLISSTRLGQYDSAEKLPTGVEPTFVYGRNLLFLILAANRAAAWGVTDIFTGLSGEDFGGYPDCRDVFVEAMQLALNQGFYGTPNGFTIHTPLMYLTKASSVKLAVDVLGDRFNEIFSLTHTCYAGVKGGCGKCHACILRDRGFTEAGIKDPIWSFRV